MTARQQQLVGEVNRLGALVSDLRRELESAAVLARDIHQCVKRGPTTEDHGLIGNLRCVLDHVAPTPPPLV